MIDLHCHVLPGIDDGPSGIAESTALARAAYEGGTRTLVATPHVNRTYPNGAGAIASLLEELDAHLRKEGVALELRAGAEIAVAQVPLLAAEEIARLGLGGGPWLLIEPPFVADVSGLGRQLADMQHAGHRILLAHPERCPGLHREPQILRSLVRSGVLTSITASSLTGRFGGDVRRFALALAVEGLIHNVASDAHDHLRRPPSIAAEIERAGLGPLHEWLTQAVPSAILDGSTAVPPRPPADLRRVRGRRRLPWHSSLAEGPIP